MPPVQHGKLLETVSIPFMMGTIAPSLPQVPDTMCMCVHAKTRAVALLSRAAEMCDDDTRLQRVVPYLLVSSSSLSEKTNSESNRKEPHLCDIHERDEADLHIRRSGYIAVRSPASVSLDGFLAPRLPAEAVVKAEPRSVYRWPDPHRYYDFTGPLGPSDGTRCL